jgi:hypothetical protein
VGSGSGDVKRGAPHLGAPFATFEVGDTGI